MNNIGIIGDADSVLGFRAFGLDAFACEDASEGADVLKKLVKEEYGIVFITEKFYEGMQEEILKYESLNLPVIVPVPGSEGSQGTGLSSIKRAVEKAVGADILFGDK